MSRASSTSWVQMVGHRPADDLAGEDVDHGSQLEEVFAGPDVIDYQQARPRPAWWR
jgi:hypothetical protein